MNTQGWIRGFMAKNMETDKFLYHVVECLSREFGKDSHITDADEEFTIKLDAYECSISMESATILKKRGAYVLDKYLLDQLRAKGFEFEVTRSQYIRYCYNIFSI